MQLQRKLLAALLTGALGTTMSSVPACAAINPNKLLSDPMRSS